MKQIQEVATATRMLRATYGIAPQQAVHAHLVVADKASRALSVVSENRAMVELAAKATLTVCAAGAFAAAEHAQAAKAVVGPVTVVMPLGGLIDPATEKARITKDIAKVEKDIGGLEKKLSNADFIAKAPEEVVAEQRGRLADEQSRRARLLEALVVLDAQ